MREPALIDLADSGQLTGKVMRLKLMVMVLVSGCRRRTAETAILSDSAGRGLHIGALELAQGPPKGQF